MTVVFLLLALPLIGADDAVQFNRDIRPLLSDNCFTCHGHDSKNRLTKLRFDTEAGAKQDLGEGRFAIVPGDPARSEMMRRIMASDPAMRMPPVATGHKLTSDQIEQIRRWIQQGAQWQQHWAWIPPKRPTTPTVQTAGWCRNPIDNFILNRLEHEGLKPSEEAGRERLIRRVALDLTGLPPTPAEVDTFLADHSPDAYEKAVDRLLASPHYGERMAQPWLDAARYADSHGYQSDGERSMWRWRDWVIDAFNSNMPFDQFTIEQIAGDMLPNATLEQKIASGFNRNHRGNGEGGIIPEEYRIEYVVDRVDTTASVWLGLTLGCARCHDHKYDPFTQKEFYQLFAYFNNLPEKGRVTEEGNSAPWIPAPTRDQQVKLRDLDRKVAAAEARLAKLDRKLVGAQRKWERSLDRANPPDWSVTRGLVARYALERGSADQLPKDKDGKPITAAWRDGDPEFQDGRTGPVASFDGKRFLDAGPAAGFTYTDKFTLAAWINPSSPNGGILSRSVDVSDGTDYLKGYGIYLKDGKVRVNLVARWDDKALCLETENAIELGRWHHVLASYDGSAVPEGVQIFVDGRPEKAKVLLDDLTAAFTIKEPLRVGAGGGPTNRFRGLIEDARVYNRVLWPHEAEALAAAESIPEIAALDSAKRAPTQSSKIRLCFLETKAPPPVAKAWSELMCLREDRVRFVESLPTVMVMREMPTPRETHVLIRGAYDRPGEKVSAGLPAILPPLPTGAANNRLGLARWLAAPSNPLTARVIVNRFWETYFGTGIVKTVEDFGSQGEWPSHPELLDWLATEFVRSGWNVKAMQRLIVTSATYRQSSRVTPDLLQRDPENRLLARGPRMRLPAEMVRDQALAISGLLVDKVGGPSVKPYQPDGLWKELNNGNEYTQDHGEDLYRRSLYTFWKRTMPPPSMMNFDAAGRETCAVRRSRTDTPMQALGLMNEVTYLEAARVLAARMMKEGGSTPEERIAFGFRLATARRPRARESAVLSNSLRHYLEKYRTDREAAVKYLSQGEHARDESLDACELAAYTVIASLICNLDETVTKS